jgi:hypothetical protein
MVSKYTGATIERHIQNGVRIGAAVKFVDGTVEKLSPQGLIGLSVHLKQTGVQLQNATVTLDGRIIPRTGKNVVDVEIPVTHDNKVVEKEKKNVFAGKKELGKTELLAILDQINEELLREDLHATFNVFGGCAMMLICNDGRRSWDLDGVLLGLPAQKASKIIDAVVARNDFTRSLFDMSIATVIYAHMQKNEMKVFEKLSNLEIRVCNERQLLAMKLFSARLDDEYQDLDDAVKLSQKLGILTANELWAILREFIKPESIQKADNLPQDPNRLTLFIQEVLRELI